MIQFFTRISILTPCLLCLFCASLSGQTHTFQQVYGDAGGDIVYDVLELSDGYLIAGEAFNPANGYSDALLIRMDKSGNVLWKKTYGQFDNDAFERLIVANDGGILAWGAVANFNLNRTDASLVKLDDAGNLLWQKTIGEASFSEYPEGEIIRMPDGYILSGVKSNPGYSQSFVIRVNNDGETIWSQFTPSDRYNVIRPAYLADSLLCLTGTVNALGCFRTMDPATGAIVQSNEYQVDTTNWFFQMQQSTDGNSVLTGAFIKENVGATRFFGWAHKVNPAGQVIWSKSYKMGVYTSIADSKALPDGGSMLLINYEATLNSGVYASALVKIDASGAVVWSKRFGGANSTYLLRLVPTSDGGFFALGYTEKHEGFGTNRDAFWIKTDSLGEVDGCCTASPKVEVTDAIFTSFQEPFSQTGYGGFAPFLFSTEDIAPLDVQNVCVNIQPTLNQTIPFCPGETVTLGDSTYSQPGTVVLTLPSTTGGCDTIATYTLEQLAQPTLAQTISFCPGETVTLGGTTYSQSGTVVLTLPSTTGGCDTIVTYTLEQLAQPVLAQTISFCPGESVTLGGTTYTQSGTVVLTLPSTTGGCDTIATYTLEKRTQPALTQTLLFCPGETVTLGGVDYSQPGTVVLTLPSTTGGCDTIATYTLQFRNSNQQSNLQLTCPKDIVRTVPAGAGAAPVTYDPPVAGSDCTCPGLPVNLDSGGASGSSFPLGISTVCFRAGDACGSVKTCCFTIRVEEENTCDSKTNGCLKFDLLPVNRDAGKNWVYRIRITNNCSAGLSYAFIELPAGVEAMAPANNSVYAAPGGSNYSVRNPNFSPYHSVRFKPAGAGIANGQSDVFRYVLPAQSDVDYIRVAVRLASDAYVETYLNTFYCPEGTEPASTPLAKPFDRSIPAASAAFRVFPNPVSPGNTLNLAGWSVPDGEFVLLDVTGRVVQKSRIVDNQVELAGAGLSSGVYYFKVLENGQFTGSGKLVVSD